MGSCITALNHNQYHEYFQRILHSFFTSKQDLLQMTTNIDSFGITFSQATRCCQNTMLWCNTSVQGLLYYTMIKNKWGRSPILCIMQKWKSKVCHVVDYNSFHECGERKIDNQYCVPCLQRKQQIDHVCFDYTGD